jgi:hypothetical protein
MSVRFLTSFLFGIGPPLSGVPQPSAKEDAHANTGEDRPGTTLGVTDDGKPNCRHEADCGRDADLDQSRSLTLRSANGTGSSNPVTRQTCVSSPFRPNTRVTPSSPWALRQRITKRL